MGSKPRKYPVWQIPANTLPPPPFPPGTGTPNFVKGTVGKIFGPPEKWGKWNCEKWVFRPIFLPFLSHFPHIPRFSSHCGSCISHPDLLMIPHLPPFPPLSPHPPPPRVNHFSIAARGLRDLRIRVFTWPEATL